MSPTNWHQARSALAGAALALVTVAVFWTVVAAQDVKSVSRLSGLTPEQADILSHMSIVYLDDGQGGIHKTIRVSGVNIQLVSGSGATNGYPADPSSIHPALVRTNGLGNLIVGYNELGNPAVDDRTGSHNLIVGAMNSYSGFGGLVASNQNRISGAYSTVSGGRDNEAVGTWCSVAGGASNRAEWHSSTVMGGLSNEATGAWSTVAGGYYNRAAGSSSTVSGGYVNLAGFEFAAVSGGAENQALGSRSWVGGGRGNTAAVSWSSIAGGQGNRSDELYTLVCGGLNRQANGQHDIVVGSIVEDN